jgi:hypothetical protein
LSDSGVVMKAAKADFREAVPTGNPERPHVTSRI